MQRPQFHAGMEHRQADRHDKFFFFLVFFLKTPPSQILEKNPQVRKCPTVINTPCFTVSHSLLWIDPFTNSTVTLTPGTTQQSIQERDNTEILRTQLSCYYCPSPHRVCEAKFSQRLAILLPQPPKCCEYRCTIPHLVCNFIKAARYKSKLEMGWFSSVGTMFKALGSLPTGVMLDRVHQCGLY